MGQSPLVGLDIGGTKIGLSIANANGEFVARERFATDPERDPHDVVREAIDRLRKTLETHGCPQPAALGVSCPGPMSSREGRFLEPPNMPRWHFFELVKSIGRHISWPAAMMNDANAGVLAEWHWGAARGADNAIFFTMSTGMGAGLILDGSVFEGPDDLAGEIGHIRLDPDGPVGFGKRGSVEGYLSGPGLVQLARSEARAALQRGERTELASVEAQIAEITTESLCRHARAGDPAARRATDRSAHALGRLCAVLTDLLNPDVFVLGTIGTAYPDLFVPGAEAILREEAVERAARRVRIVPSSLGETRGDLAAIAVARRLVSC